MDRIGAEVGLTSCAVAQDDFAQGLAEGLGPGLLRERSLVESCGAQAGQE